MRRLWFVSLSLIFLGAVTWWAVFDYHQRRKEMVNEAWSQLEMQIVKGAARSSQAWMVLWTEKQGQSKDAAAKVVWRRFIAPILLLDNGRTWFFHRDHLINAMLPDLPSSYQNRSAEEIFEAQKSFGASGFLPLLNGIQNAEDGKGWFVWNTERGREIAAWASWILGDDSWTVVLSTPEKEILDHSGLSEELNREFIGAGVVTGVLFIVFLSAWWQERKNKIVLDTLELTVSERTVELSQANERLRLELSERQKAEEALRESESRLRTLMDTVNEGLVVSDEKGMITYVNDRLAEITGQRREEWMGRPAGYFLDRSGAIPSDPEDTGELNRPGEPFELGWIRKDGAQVVLLVSPSQLFDSRNNYMGAIAALTDITGLKRAQLDLKKSKEELEERIRQKTTELEKTSSELREELAERQRVDEALSMQEDRYTLATRAGRVGLWDWNINTGEIFMDPTLMFILGYQEGEIENSFDAWLDLIHKEDQPVIREMIQAQIEGRADRYTGEHRKIHKDGSLRWMRLMGAIIRDGVGTPVRMVGTETDITEQKDTEDTSKANEEKYRTILGTIQEGYYEVDLDGIFTFCNESMCRLLGYPESEIIGMNFLVVMDPEAGRQVRQVFSRVYETEEPEREIGWQIIRKDGVRRWVESSITMIRKEDGEGIGFRGIVRDITEMKDAADRIRESEDRYKSLFELARDAAFLTDLDTGLIVDVNRAAEKLLNRTRNEIVGSHHSRVHPSLNLDNYEKAASENQPIGTGNPVQSEVIAKDGRSIPVEISYTFFQVGPKRLLQEVFRDITLRKEAEKELTRAKEVAETANRSKVRFISNLSRELQSPLNGMLNEIGQLIELGPRGPNEHSAVAQETGRAMLALLRDMADFPRIIEGNFRLANETFDLQDLVGDTLKMVACQAREKSLELAFGLRRGVPEKVVGDPTRLRQVLLALLSNALKFTGKGEVVVEVETEPIEENQALFHFSVRDTGVGLPPEMQKSIFDLFMGTEPDPTQLPDTIGLGLTISALLIRSMGGKIWVVSETGTGSTFHFSLRLGVSPEAGLPDSNGYRRFLNGRRTLMVSRNKTIRGVFANMLADWGMEPTTTVDEEQGAAILEKAALEGRPIELAVIDLDSLGENDRNPFHPFPGISKSRPLPVVLLVDAGKHRVIPQEKSSITEHILVKPIKPAQLLELISKLLNRDSLLTPTS